ncbi:hypothetical protein JTE90_001129 [Oedothorax gibbosus]|uniref:Chitin-binding type-2 domain-containing protein n=1 Tax=Oedothorax gibbosus TaxID=931172 RepID=A0AAV6VIH6_9ARAC|nr:hypothetical protein JTE90_001129 [Oedothorax gibbosus]
MAKWKICTNRKANIFILLTTFLCVGIKCQSDWMVEMEDAFEIENKETDMLCKKGPSEKLIFCRYQNDGRISLSTLNHCLCSCIIFSTELFDSVPTSLKSLQSLDASTRVLASVPVHKINMSSLRHSPQKLVAWMKEQSFDGIDLRIAKEKSLNDFPWSVFLEYIRDIRSVSNIEARRPILIVTIVRSFLAFLNDSQISEMTSYSDYISLQPESHDSEDIIDEYFDDIENIGTSQFGKIEFNKVLMPISLKASVGQVTGRTNETFPELCKHLRHITENKSNTLSEEQNLFEIIREQVHFANEIEAAGIDVWSLNDDDSYNTCEKSPFPLIKEISTSLLKEEETFTSFADLDIDLSTGESQLDEIEVLQEPNIGPEEIRKFKCERIGFYRHPSDCSKFYHCAEHRATSSQPSTQYAVIVYKCPPGLVYDELQGACNWPSYSEPCRGSDELLPVPSKKFQCVDPGFHADPEDCRWFYYCSDLGDGRLAAFEFQCPSHLLGFDEEELLCNWKWMVPSCVNYGTENKGEAYKEKENNDQENRSNSEVEHNSDFIIPEGVTSAPDSRRTLKDVEIVNTTPTFSLNLNSVDGSLNHRIPLSSFLVNEGVENKNSSSADITLTKSNQLSVDSSRSNDSLNKSNEKKYGTAYWHRSMATTKSPDNQQRNRLDSLIEKIRSLKLTNSSTESLKTIEPNAELKLDHKYGIGTVRKISLPLIQGKGYLPENPQSRSIGDSISSSYHFENNLNDHEISNKQKSFAQVRCSKIKDKSDSSDPNAGENNFGCAAEVSLTVNVKQGKEYDKYILKPDQVTISSISKPEHMSVFSNHTSNDKTLILQKLQIGNTRKETLRSDSNYDGHSSQYLRSSSVQGRKAPDEINKFEFSQRISNNGSRNTNALLESKNRLSDDNPSRLVNAFSRQSHEINDHNNMAHRNSNYRKATTETLVRVPRTKLLEHFVEKENIMPMMFYPEGVLLSVDLNHINEIPPQILLEVDNMLKKYMSDGNIDLHLLMQKLNATSESMLDMENAKEIKSNDIDDMIEVIENLLNTTNNVHNATTAHPVEKISNDPTNFSNNTDNLQLGYENVTNKIENSLNDKETEKITVSTESVNKKISNMQDMKSNPLISEKILNVPENEPFVRRRLFRKQKFPSIREQLEFQRQSAHRRNSLHSILTTTSPSVHNSTRHRYPSIRQQLFLNNKRKSSLSARNNVVWKRLRGMQMTTTKPNINAFGSNNPTQSLDFEANGVNHRHSGNGHSFLEPTSLRNPDINFKNRNLERRVNPHVKPNQPEDSDTESKNFQFGDRIRSNDFNRIFNSPPQISTLDSELNNPKNYLNEHQRDSLFTSDEVNKPESSAEPIIITMDITSKTSSDEEIIPNIHSHRETFQEERYSEPTANEYHNVDYPNTGKEGSKEFRNSRKLRIVVKKRFPSVQTSYGNSSNTQDSQLDQPHMRMRIPKKLLNELKSNALRKLALNGRSEVKLQIQFQDHVWNVPFVNDKSSVNISPVACTRPGLFQHPKDCNKFYECFWDKWLQKFTLHVFPCPVRLVYDESIRGCSHPSFESHCRNTLR